MSAQEQARLLIERVIGLEQRQRDRGYSQSLQDEINQLNAKIAALEGQRTQTVVA